MPNKKLYSTRLAVGSDFLKIAAGTFTELPEHTPAEVILLQRVQSNSTSFEHSFSILKKRLQPGNFKNEKIIILFINIVLIKNFTIYKRQFS